MVRDSAHARADDSGARSDRRGQPGPSARSAGSWSVSTRRRVRGWAGFHAAHLRRHRAPRRRRGDTMSAATTSVAQSLVGESPPNLQPQASRRRRDQTFGARRRSGRRIQQLAVRSASRRRIPSRFALQPRRPPLGRRGRFRRRFPRRQCQRSTLRSSHLRVTSSLHQVGAASAPSGGRTSQPGPAPVPAI